MKSFIPLVFSLFFAMGLITDASGQVINFEETWKAFLKENKTSNISKLPQPPPSSIDFPKYCLMYANSNFCFNRITNAERFMSKIAETDEKKLNAIPGFMERYTDLGTKIKAYHTLDKIWERFIVSYDVTLDELDKVKTARRVCEKGTLAKYTQMETYIYYCQGDVEKSKNLFENFVLRIVEKTTLKSSDVNGLDKELDIFRALFKVLPTLNKEWAAFMKSGESTGFDQEIPVLNCNVNPNIKGYLLEAASDICNKGMEMLKKIKALEAKANGNIDKDVAEKIKWLEESAGDYSGDEVALNKAWTEFTPNNTLAKQLDWTLTYCKTIDQIRSYAMNGILNCDQAVPMTKKIKELSAKLDKELDKTTAAKIAVLEKNIETNNGDLDALTAAWEAFVPENQLTDEPDYTLIYCDKVAQIRSYTMNGVLHHCTEGEAMIAKIEAVQKNHKVELDETTAAKVKTLNDLVAKTKNDLSALNASWKKLTAEDDTLTEPHGLADTYCDKVAQVRYWTIQGHLNYDNVEGDNKYHTVGDDYNEKIQALIESDKLELDEELTCSIKRMNQKIWKYKYWQIVLQARKETHEERERFGPEAAKIMYDELNGDKQPCETTVEYGAVGNIGVKYTISTYLCQNINLAKMGDPEFYKKIASWLDANALQKYCEADLRCKTDFSIYIEGHSDGNRFGGARYKKSLDIPSGTPYKHFINNEIHNKVTEREITNRLKSNEELGIARAWTVKQQLDFMGAPISIGAYEHPASEKGGQYRKVQIELYIPNLLLDYYEKRLATIWEESGIGEVPKVCE